MYFKIGPLPPVSNLERWLSQADVRKSSTTIHHVVGPIHRRGDLHHRSVDSLVTSIWSED